MHPLPNTVYRGSAYEYSGAFMSKQLTLRALRDFGYATYMAPKPLNQDEDNVASQYKDTDAWTIHRKRAWTVLLKGGHYDYIDFSIINGCETGTPASQAAIRSRLQHLSTLVHALDLVRARPLPGLLTDLPPHTLDVVFGVPGEDYALYLADERELAAARDLPDGDQADRRGWPIRGHVTLSVPAGHYTLATFDPATGRHLLPRRVHTEGGPLRLAVPESVLPRPRAAPHPHLAFALGAFRPPIRRAIHPPQPSPARPPLARPGRLGVL